MAEIRRIRDDDLEAERVVELWDRSCREDPDGLDKIAEIGERSRASSGPHGRQWRRDDVYE